MVSCVQKAFSIISAMFLIIIIFMSGCSNRQSVEKKTDIQGHRGCRGLMPENTIPGFIKAIELGVTTLEMDVVISKDKKVVVSHEPFLSHEICLTPDGKEISEADEKSYNLFQMTYDEIKTMELLKDRKDLPKNPPSPNSPPSGYSKLN